MKFTVLTENGVDLPDLTAMFALGHEQRLQGLTLKARVQPTCRRQTLESGGAVLPVPGMG